MYKKALIISISLISAIFFVFSFTTPTNAHMAGPHFGEGFEQNMNHDNNEGPGICGADNFQRLGRYLDLSLEQRQKLHKIRFDLMKKTIDLQDELGQKRLERRALMENDDIDWKKADQLTDEIAVIRAKLQKRRMRQRPEIRKILTPEQLERFDEIRGWKGRSQCDIPPGKGFGRGPGRGQGPGLGRGMGW